MIIGITFQLFPINEDDDNIPELVIDDEGNGMSQL
jgi:hypothetical protein